MEQITPDWITNTLKIKGAIDENMSVTDIKLNREQMLNCTVYYLSLCYNREVSEAAPQRLFLKLPNADFYEPDTEVQFYNTILPMMQETATQTWPFLRCYDAAWSTDTGRVHFLFEDLSLSHFTTPNLMPPTQKFYKRVIDLYAYFHAFWWEHPKLGREIGHFLTAETIDGFVTRIQRKLSQVVDEIKVDLSKRDHEVLERVASAWPKRRLERVLQGKGVTLVHRDPHPGNLLYPKNAVDGVIKLIDWQSWRVDTGTDDLAYLMAFHWPQKTRKQIETGLVKRYYHQLMKNGVENYTWDDCYYAYQASIIRCLSFLIMAWSPANWERIQRGIAAFKDWHCEDILAN